MDQLTNDHRIKNAGSLVPCAHTVHTFEIGKTQFGHNLDFVDTQYYPTSAKHSSQYFNFNYRIKDRLFLCLQLRLTLPGTPGSSTDSFLIAHITDIFLITCMSRQCSYPVPSLPLVCLLCPLITLWVITAQCTPLAWITSSLQSFTVRNEMIYCLGNRP